MKLYVQTDGSLTSIYDETLDTRGLGPQEIRRASHVEPNAEGNWTADLRPVGGPRLGPYSRRSQALAVELARLETFLRK